MDQRSVISLTSFIDLLDYVNNIKKRNSSRPNSMASGASKIEGNKIELILLDILIYLLEIKRPLTVRTSSYAGTKSDQLLLAQTFIDVIGARLNPEVNEFDVFLDIKFYFLWFSMQKLFEPLYSIYLSDVMNQK
jgi:hypothetical protein